MRRMQPVSLAARFTPLLAVTSVLAWSGPAAADSWNIDLVGSLPGYLFDVQIAGGYAYGATGSGLLVLDVSSAEGPVQASFLPLEGPSAVALEDQRAYLAGTSGFGEGELTIVDISDPEAPAVIGRFTDLYNPIDLVVRGALAYVADSRRGLRIIDVSEPTKPTQVGMLPSSRTLNGLDLAGTRVYLADEADGLYIVDVSNPAQPVQLGRFDPGWGLRDVLVQGNRAYLACAPGVRVVDVSNPAAPAQVGSFTCAEVRRLACDEDRLYLSHWYSIRILDVHDPTAPAEMSLTEICGRPYRVALGRDVAYVAGWNGGLRVLDVQDPADPQEIASFDLVGDAIGLHRRGHRLYLAGGYRVAEELKRGARDPSAFGSAPGNAAEVSREQPTSGLYVVDLSTPAKPLVKSFRPYGNAFDVALQDSLACVTDWGGRFGVFSVSAPDDPAYLGWAPTGYWTTRLDVEGRYAYVLIEYDLLIFDLIDPSAPVLVGSIRTGTNAIDVQGSYAYTLDSYSGLSVIDVSDPIAPVALGSFDMENWAEGLAVEGDYAYIANGAIGLRILDIRDPNAPVEVGLHDTPGYAQDVTVAEGRAYVADREVGLRVFDVTDPAAPQEIAYYATTAKAWDVAVSGDEIVVGTYEGGLFVLRSRFASDTRDAEANPRTTRPTRVLPNPFGDRTEIRFAVSKERAAGDRTVRLAIFSADGRLVARLIDWPLSSGPHVVAWQGRDQQGGQVPSGAYFYRLETDGWSERGGITVIR